MGKIQKELRRLASQEGCDGSPYDEMQQAAERIATLEKQYYGLIMEVATKFPGETRHETALRYIRQAERGSDQCVAAQKQEVG